MVTKATNSVLDLVNPPIDQIVLVAPLAASSGGTGHNTLPIGAVLAGNGTSPVSEIDPGTTGQVMISNGASTPPSFQNLTVSAGSITGIISVAHGGTGDNSLLDHAVLLGQGAAGIGFTAPGLAGIPLVSNGASADPSFTQLDLSQTFAIANTLLLNNSPTKLLFGSGAAGAFAFTVPAGKTSVTVWGVGGGAGGATVNAGSTTSGGGGGAGGVFIGQFACSPGDSINGTIGAAGLGGAAGAAHDGANGGTTTVNLNFTLMFQATGGVGGKCIANGAGGTGGVGSKSGAVLNGYVDYGGEGSDGSTADFNAVAGTGGASFFGGGGRGSTTGGVGSYAQGSGGGGTYGPGTPGGGQGATGSVFIWG